MGATINYGAVATQKVTITYSVEEAIRLADTFDKMLNAVVCMVTEGEADRKLLDEALAANIFVGTLRSKVYNAVLGECES